MAVIFRQKYVKQAVLIICTLLFFLSSFEWTDPIGRTVNEKGQLTEQLSQSVIKEKNTNSLYRLVEIKIVFFDEPHFACKPNLYNYFKLPEKRFLLIHSLRI